MDACAVIAPEREGILRVRPSLRVLQAIYHDPVNYPPTLNAGRVLAEAGAEVLCLGYDRGLSANLPTPPRMRIEYLNRGEPGYASSSLGNWRQLVAFRGHLKQEIDRFRPDLIIAYDHWGAFALLTASLATGPRKIVHLHDIPDEKALPVLSTDRLVWTGVKRALRHFPLVVVPERARATFLREHHGLMNEIATVGNSPTRGRPVRNDSLRKLLPGVGSDPLAVTVGGMSLCAETVRALARTRAQWHLVVIGCRVDAWLSAMREEATRLKLTHRLHILPYTDYDTVRAWLPGCDLGLAFYARYTNPNWILMGAGSVKIQEYMAAGIPSLVGPPTSLGELAQDTGALELIDDDSEQAIAAGLDRLEPGSARWNSLAGAAVESHLSKYNCEAQLAPLIARLGLDR